jgi:hypothetical protein
MGEGEGEQKRRCALWLETMVGDGGGDYDALGAGVVLRDGPCVRMSASCGIVLSHFTVIVEPAW